MRGTFEDLPREKQEAILLAAMEVFAQNEYKRASTDVIAAKAGISKGLLFYYFRNKRVLYERVYAYAQQLAVEASAASAEVLACTDLFDLMEAGARVKIELMACYPYLADFTVRAFLSKSEDVSSAIDKRNTQLAEQAWDVYCAGVDTGKFREDISPKQILKMLVFMADGYLREQQRAGSPFDVDVLMAEFKTWSALMRRIAYKEEYL